MEWSTSSTESTCLEADFPWSDVWPRERLVIFWGKQWGRWVDTICCPCINMMSTWVSSVFFSRKFFIWNAICCCGKGWSTEIRPYMVEPDSKAVVLTCWGYQDPSLFCITAMEDSLLQALGQRDPKLAMVWSLCKTNWVRWCGEFTNLNLQHVVIDFSELFGADLHQQGNCQWSWRKW